MPPIQATSGKNVVVAMDLRKIKEKFKASDGILRTSDFTVLKIDYRGIQKLIANGIVEKIRSGYYRLVEAENAKSEAVLIANLFPDGVLCMNSALFYYRYSDRTPLDWDIAINKNTSKSRFKIDYPYVKPYYVEPELLSIGVTTAEYEDCTMQIYNKDRLICECLKYENKIDKETFNKAIQAYIDDPKKNISKLLEYAKLRKVTKKVHDIIGVWL